MLAYGGVSLWRYFSIRESTDDAQVDGHVYPVSARVEAWSRVLVDDNQYVTAGTVLVEFDTKDYRVAQDRARADLAESAATLRRQPDSDANHDDDFGEPAFRGAGWRRSGERGGERGGEVGGRGACASDCGAG